MLDDDDYKEQVTTQKARLIRSAGQFKIEDRFKAMQNANLYSIEKLLVQPISHFATTIYNKYKHQRIHLKNNK